MFEPLWSYLGASPEAVAPRAMPICEIKIEKTFVQDAPRDASDAALIESILVVAEGVETQEQADFLNQRGTACCTRGISLVARTRLRPGCNAGAPRAPPSSSAPIFIPGHKQTRKR